ncbi:hypothetical protein K438DRAFT_1784466 [Mycena galopus ATCC 62051]|nr:hypothetical protein K438DRAFT_1784466 [Mycena galopus ATCC 62051]
MSFKYRLLLIVVLFHLTAGAYARCTPAPAIEVRCTLESGYLDLQSYNPVPNDKHNPDVVAHPYTAAPSRATQSGRAGNWVRLPASGLRSSPIHHGFNHRAQFRRGARCTPANIEGILCIHFKQDTSGVVRGARPLALALGIGVESG